MIGAGDFARLVEAGSGGVKGAVFVEIPFYIQALDYAPAAGTAAATPVPREGAISGPWIAGLDGLATAVREPERPVLALGHEISRTAAAGAHSHFEAMGPPIR